MDGLQLPLLSKDSTDHPDKPKRKTRKAKVPETQQPDDKLLTDWFDGSAQQSLSQTFRVEKSPHKALCLKPPLATIPTSSALWRQSKKTAFQSAVVKVLLHFLGEESPSNVFHSLAYIVHEPILTFVKECVFQRQPQHCLPPHGAIHNGIFDSLGPLKTLPLIGCIGSGVTRLPRWDHKRQYSFCRAFSLGTCDLEAQADLYESGLSCSHHMERWSGDRGQFPGNPKWPQSQLFLSSQPRHQTSKWGRFQRNPAHSLQAAQQGRWAVLPTLPNCRLVSKIILT